MKATVEIYPRNVKHADHAFCTPYVNLNGNSRKQLIENCYSVIDAIGNAMDKIARSDFNHGRNGMTGEHRDSLRESVTNDINTLRELSTKYHKILDNLTQDREGNYFTIR